MADGSGSKAKSVKDRDSSSASRMVHILIVEDSDLVTNALKVLFEAHGFRVSIADDIATGVERATSSAIDVLLLDLTLPDGDGLAIIQLLRERNALPRATIALTGHDDLQTVLRDPGRPFALLPRLVPGHVTHPA